MFKRLILGPQRPDPNLGLALIEADLPSGPIGVISAGWQEAEGELADVQQQVGRPLISLRLHERAETIFDASPDLRAMHNERQHDLKELKRLYRLRLKQLMIAARQVLDDDSDRDLLAAEQRHAISQLRALDRHYLHRVAAVEKTFEETLGSERPEILMEQAAAIETELAGCETVMITGGNVLVLLNRIHLFGLQQILEKKHLIAWSAGAMVLSDRIVLYHDRTPLGRRDPEMMSAGTGLFPGIVYLPDARKRLRDRDRVHLALISRRFSPAFCVAIDNGSMLLFDERELLMAEGARRLTRTGRMTKVRVR